MALTAPPNVQGLPVFEEGTVLPGRLAIALAAHFPQWVRRRTTTFTFLDEKAYEQRLDVNLHLPPPEWFANGKGRDLARMLVSAASLPRTIYVPINIVRKGVVAAFRITDADERTVSMRNRLERCRLTIDAFSSLVDQYGADAGLGRPPGFFRPVLESIVAAPVSGARVLENAMRGDLGKLLRDDDPYLQLLRQLADGFMMLVPVPSEPADHLFHVVWTERYRWSPRSAAGAVTGLRSRLARAAGALLSRCSSSLGWTAKSLVFPHHSIGWAQSTHFVVREPADAHNLRVALVREGTDDPPLHEVSAQPRADVSISTRDPLEPATASEGRASVIVRLGPRRSGAFGAITTVAWASAALMLVISHYLSKIDLEASTTIAVVLPAVIAASLIRHGEHAIAGLLLGGVRTCGLLVTLLVFAVAAFMATASPQRASGSAAAVCRTESVAGDRSASGPAPPWAALLAPLAARTGAGAPSIACDIEPTRTTGAGGGGSTAANPGPPAGERLAVHVAIYGTWAVALVLSFGMVATWWRIFFARRRPTRRNGRPVETRG